MYVFTDKISLNDFIKEIKVAKPNAVVHARGDLAVTNNKVIALKSEKIDRKSYDASIICWGETISDSEFTTLVAAHNFTTGESNLLDASYNFDNSGKLFRAMCIINHQLLVERGYTGSLDDYRQLIIAKAKTL